MQLVREHHHHRPHGVGYRYRLRGPCSRSGIEGVGVGIAGALIDGYEDLCAVVEVAVKDSGGVLAGGAYAAGVQRLDAPILGQCPSIGEVTVTHDAVLTHRFGHILTYAVKDIVLIPRKLSVAVDHF